MVLNCEIGIAEGKPLMEQYGLDELAASADAVVPGLMAIGEAASVSVHGANRLGSNSLLDLVIFGREAARHCATTLTPGAAQRPLARGAGEGAVARVERLRGARGARPTAQIRLEMQQIMQAHAAVFRTGETLAAGWIAD